MNEVLAMFRSPRMIKLMIFCTVSFAMISALFKNSIVLVPGVTEIRLVNALALSYGLFFGPAGALGCALGNLIGDFFGSLSWLSLFGMIGNFFSAYLPYKIWDALAPAAEFRTRPGFRARHAWLRLFLAGLLSVLSCAAFLAFSFDLGGALPALTSFNLIFLNNIVATFGPGLLLFWLFTRLPQNILPYWKDWLAAEGYQGLEGFSRYAIQGCILLSLFLALALLAVNLRQGFPLMTGGSFGNRPLLFGLGVYLLFLLFFSLQANYRRQPQKGD